MYIIETEEGRIKSTAKGVSRNIKEKCLRLADYKNALFTNHVYKHPSVRINQSEHKVYTQVSSKTSLSSFNDKKWIIRDGDEWTTFSFGHYKIEEKELMDIFPEDMVIDEDAVELLASLI